MLIWSPTAAVRRLPVGATFVADQTAASSGAGPSASGDPGWRFGPPGTLTARSGPLRGARGDRAASAGRRPARCGRHPPRARGAQRTAAASLQLPPDAAHLERDHVAAPRRCSRFSDFTVTRMFSKPGSRSNAPTTPTSTAPDSSREGCGNDASETTSEITSYPSGFQHAEPEAGSQAETRRRRRARTRAPRKRPSTCV